MNNDIDLCVKCQSPRIKGGPDCPACDDFTDICSDCGASQHDCPQETK